MESCGYYSLVGKGHNELGELVGLYVMIQLMHCTPQDRTLNNSQVVKQVQISG